jgi:hypothetical protein
MHPDEFITNHYPLTNQIRLSLRGSVGIGILSLIQYSIPYKDIIYTYTYVVVKPHAAYVWGQEILTHKADGYTSLRQMSLYPRSLTRIILRGYEPCALTLSTRIRIQHER